MIFLLWLESVCLEFALVSHSYKFKIVDSRVYFILEFRLFLKQNSNQVPLFKAHF